MMPPLTPEHKRLADSEARKADWKLWGPYVSERAWGTVREDYSAYGEAWDYFPHAHAPSRAYRWNEDGIGGYSNRLQNICMGVALWNEKDPILKERMFGLSGTQGNHGEDVKEYYFYLDSTPTHSYAKMLYKYPQVVFPYGPLVEENRRRTRMEPECDLYDAIPDVFGEGRYFDVYIEYAKAGQEDILCRITAINRGPEPAPLHILPHLWYRNTWTWDPTRAKPTLEAAPAPTARVKAVHRHLGTRWWNARHVGHTDPLPLLFTENETNYERLFGDPNAGPYTKDGIHDAVVHGLAEKINAREGTKVAAHAHAVLAPGESMTVEVRFSDHVLKQPFRGYNGIFEKRQAEADAFYQEVQRKDLSDELKQIQRQAFAGLMWSKQFYHYSVELWINGDPGLPPPPPARKYGRNANWSHLYNLDVISMPDKWEYPWYAVWDLAFHMVPVAMIDPEWAKWQLILVLREWYMHPTGQIPAYEWALGDVNPPVHAWGAWQVYKISREVTGIADTLFLERIFQKLLINFTWWVNRKDNQNNNIFQGGFLGLDNIMVFDRSAPLPTGGYLEQADGTAWMGMYCLNMLTIALELARTRPSYEDVATKFFEHFIYIAHAINRGYDSDGLWDEEDGFYYDYLHTPDDQLIPLKVRSVVGLIPLFAVATLDEELLEQLPRFRRRMQWFHTYRPHLLEPIAEMMETGEQNRHLFALVDREQMQRILQRMLDENEFLSDYGLRALSKYHDAHPFTLHAGGEAYTVKYTPAESTSASFGGNSNWRGPIWFPVNYLMVISLRKFYKYYGDSLKVELPTGSGNWVTLDAVADELSRRLIRIFEQDETGDRPFHGDNPYFQKDPHWQDHTLFFEYFNGDTGAGLGASHQTGWTALVARLIHDAGAI